MFFGPLIAALMLQTAQPADATVTIGDAITAVEAGDYSRAMAIGARFAEAGHPDGHHLLGHMYANGLGVDPDVTKAVEHYVAAATAGQTNAQYALGELAYTGDGVKQDWGRAAEWYNLAAAKDHQLAKTRLAYMYMEGQSVPQDPQRAAYLFQEVAEAGLPAAQYHLALIYLEGSGLPKDFAKAAKWFEAAAQQGDPDSMYNLALMHEAGRTAEEPNYGAAVTWMRQAAEAGVLPAKTSMGLLAYNGRGMARSEGEALRWFRESARDGDPEGMFLYAVSLTEGLGGQRNFDEALRWVERSIRESRNEGSIAVQERLELRDQIRHAIAQRRLFAQQQESDQAIEAAQQVSLFSQPIALPPSTPPLSVTAPTSQTATEEEATQSTRRRRGLR